MKRRFVLPVVSLAVAACVSACTAGPQTESLGDGLYGISMGDLSMTVDAEHGAKILSFKYGDKEIISQLQNFNAFGSTFWTSPQSEWNWPPVAEYDRLPYEVVMGDDYIEMTGQVSERFGYSIGKKFTADAKDGAMVVTYTITNHTDSLRRVAPWEITRVPGSGLIFFEALSSAITPAGLMDFDDAYGCSWYSFDESDQNRKINVNGKGWLAYADNGLMLVKSFDDLAEGECAPQEAEIQVYVNQGKTFIELESQGAYTELGPGESLSYTVKWYLVPVETASEPYEELVGTVHGLVR